jgi:hypothetical protein
MWARKYRRRRVRIVGTFRDGADCEDFEVSKDGDSTRGKSAECILPAWFVPQMMNKPGKYGLMLSGGNILAIERILEVHAASDGTIWLDVRMIATGDYLPGSLDRRVFTAPPDALEASVNAGAVVAAFTFAKE